jgi:hypothetical protein
VGNQETLTNAAAAFVNAPAAAMPIRDGKKQIELVAFVAMSAVAYLSCVFKEARLFCPHGKGYRLITKEIVFPSSLSL